MNRKQIVCMWLGILAIVLPGILTILLIAVGESSAGFYRWVFIQVLITGGLIITFRNKKDKKA